MLARLREEATRRVSAGTSAATSLLPAFSDSQSTARGQAWPNESFAPLATSTVVGPLPCAADLLNTIDEIAMPGVLQEVAPTRSLIEAARGIEQAAFVWMLRASSWSIATGCSSVKLATSKQGTGPERGCRLPAHVAWCGLAATASVLVSRCMARVQRSRAEGQSVAPTASGLDLAAAAQFLPLPTQVRSWLVRAGLVYRPVLHSRLQIKSRLDEVPASGSTSKSIPKAVHS